MRYLAIAASADDREHGHDNSTSVCGSFNRVNLCPAAGCAEVTPFNALMFHFVGCTVRPSGPFSVAHVEAAFDAKLRAAAAAKRYDAFFDYSLALWVSSLDGYVAALRADGIEVLALAWEDESGAQYFSLLVFAPRSQSVVELISSAAPASLHASELLREA